MNYIEFYPGDYARDTADLSLVEHGAYLLLLSHYYATERPLPNENPAVFRIARAMSPDEQSAVLRVLDRFFPLDPADGLRHNARCDEEITKALDRIEKNRINGGKGGRPKKPKQNPAVNPNETDRLTQTGTETGTQTKGHHTPHAIEDQKQKRASDDAPVDPVAALWARWKALPDGGGGAFLARLVKTHGEAAVLAAVERALDHAPADPKSFVQGCLRKANGAETAHDALIASAVWEGKP